MIPANRYAINVRARLERSSTDKHELAINVTSAGMSLPAGTSSRIVEMMLYYDLLATTREFAKINCPVHDSDGL